MSVSLSDWKHQTHNPPTPALTKSLKHNQILFNPNQQTALVFSNIPMICLEIQLMTSVSVQTTISVAK